jgi:large subunit ribosomal protein L10
MVMTREEKVAKAAEVRERIDRASAMVFVDFGGVPVELITDLRNRFREAGVEYQVVKNNVVRKALQGHPLAESAALNTYLKGMTGIAWTYEDPSAAAKIIRAFRKEGDAYEKLEVKCGVIDNEVLDAAQVENTLANLPGKNEVRAMLLAQLLAPAESLVRQLNAPGQNLVYAFDAYDRKHSEGA